MCQASEVVPAGTAAVRFTAVSAASPGPGVQVVLRQGGRVLDRGEGVTDVAQAGGAVIVPIAHTARDLTGVEVCLTFATDAPVAAIVGPQPPSTPAVRLDGRPLRGKSLPIAYLRPGRESWWSYASTVATRMGLGRGEWGGGWIVGLVVVLLLAAAALVVRATWRTVVGDPPADPATDASGRWWGRIPRLAWTIAAVAVLNAAAWSFITPAFQAPDEPTHVAYAQLIGERGRPPVPRSNERLTPELQRTLDDLRFETQSAPDLWLASQQRRLDHDLRHPLARSGTNEVGPAAPEPPLYYALAAIPYRLASGATLLDQVALMRLLSALLAGVTALFAFLFVRECLPARPWTWTVGALGVALVPTLGFISGAVNPDALLLAICAVLFYALAVAFRRGLTTRLAVGIGVVLAVGIVAKINFYGLVPGALLAVALSARASAHGWNRGAARLVAIVVGIAVVPYLLMTALDAAVWERAFILARTPAEAPRDHGGIGGQLSYLWQLFLPRLPGQTAAFPELSPPYELWLKGFVGRFGWVRVHYAPWGYRLGALVLAALALLSARALTADRLAVRRRASELAGYAAMTAGLLLLIGLVALRGWAPSIQGAVQGRYLLPLLPLFGALLALAARGAGERWGRATGVAIVVLCLAWSLFGQLATIAYYYG